MKLDLINADCWEHIKTLKDNSIHHIITDPPYDIGFMNKGWDKNSIVSNPEFWKECLRVLKPGGHLLAFSHSRTSHRQTSAIEQAGFEIRDTIMWLYGSGFPKSHNIGKKLDDWKGWGTALKPAHEPVVMARKPFEGTVANNVLEHGTGAINIDATRIINRWPANVMLDEEAGKILDEQAPKVGSLFSAKRTKDTTGGSGNSWTTGTEGNKSAGSDNGHYDELGGASRFFYCPKVSSKERNAGCDELEANSTGRFPANVILDEEAGKILDEQSGITKSSKRGNKYNKQTENRTGYTPVASDYRDDNTYDDSGGASRFFYCPKVSSKERNAGCEELEDKEWNKEGAAIPERDNRPFKPSKNNHPTVKPIKLMEYLIKLVSKEGQTILDPFLGSGSTGIACKNLNRDFIGIERDENYFQIAQTRIGENNDADD